ncbi:MAG: GtrA family protein [Opitutales bacterium]
MPLKLLKKIHRSERDIAAFTRFAGVGVAISLIDAGGLYLLIAAGLNIYLSRVLSYTAAMSAGYILNRYFTFHHLETGRALWHSLLRHFSVHAIGGVLNFAVFALVLEIGRRMGGEVAVSAFLPLAGVWIGGLAGLCFNFFFSKKLVFDN